MRKAWVVWVIALVGWGLGSHAQARGAVMIRQAVKGTLIVVSDLPQADYVDYVSKLRPKYVQWVGLNTPKPEVAMPPGPLAMVLFLLMGGAEPAPVHPTWHPDLPVSPSSLRGQDIMIAAKTVHPDPAKRDQWYATVVIMAPNERLLGTALDESLTLRNFPLGKPIVHRVADLRNLRAVACLSLAADRELRPIAEAAEAALYTGFLNLRAFRVVGREAVPAGTPPDLSTLPRMRAAARELGVDAFVIAEISDASTICREHTEFYRSSRRGVSEQRQAEWDRMKARLEAEGKKPRRSSPEPDLVWAAPYQVWNYVTSVRGSIRLISAATGEELWAQDINETVEQEEKAQVRNQDYGWYRIEDLDQGYLSRPREYTVRLRTELAAARVRQQAQYFVSFVGSRSMLPTPGQVLEQTAAEGSGDGVKVLSVEGTEIYIAAGATHGVEIGDTFSLWVERELKDPDTGETIEHVRSRRAQIRVVEVFERTSRCEPLEGSLGESVRVGDIVVPD